MNYIEYMNSGNKIDIPGLVLKKPFVRMVLKPDSVSESPQGIYGYDYEFMRNKQPKQNKTTDVDNTSVSTTSTQSNTSNPTHWLTRFANKIPYHAIGVGASGLIGGMFNYARS